MSFTGLKQNIISYKSPYCIGYGATKGRNFNVCSVTIRKRFFGRPIFNFDGMRDVPILYG